MAEKTGVQLSGGRCGGSFECQGQSGAAALARQNSDDEVLVLYDAYWFIEADYEASLAQGSAGDRRLRLMPPLFDSSDGGLPVAEMELEPHEASQVGRRPWLAGAEPPPVVRFICGSHRLP